MRDTLHDNTYRASLSSINDSCVMDHIYRRASKDKIKTTDSVWMIAPSDEQHLSKI